MLYLWDAHDTKGIRNHILFWVSHLVAFGKYFKEQLLKSISENVFKKYSKLCSNLTLKGLFYFCVIIL